jgi:hypothetical protein
MVAPVVGLERGGGEQGTGPGEWRDMAGMGGLSVLLSYLEAKERSEIEHLRRFERRGLTACHGSSSHGVLSRHSPVAKKLRSWTSFGGAFTCKLLPLTRGRAWWWLIAIVWCCRMPR